MFVGHYGMSLAVKRTDARLISDRCDEYREQGKWEIVAFHNAPVQMREEEETGFVIHTAGPNQDMRT